MPALFSEYSALVRKLEERLTTEKLDKLRNYGERFSTVENLQKLSKSARLASGSEVQVPTFVRVFWR